MKSYHVHYANKYPGGQVKSSEDSLDVWNADGEHCVSMRKNGQGQWQDVSEEYGCRDAHDLAPIPKNTRFMKMYPSGKIAKSEEHADRFPIAQKLADHKIGGPGKVPSLAELDQAGEKCSDSQSDAASKASRSWIG